MIDNKQVWIEADCLQISEAEPLPAGEGSAAAKRVVTTAVGRVRYRRDVAEGQAAREEWEVDGMLTVSE